MIPGQENSGKLVTLLKREARALCAERGYSTLLCDGSPGIGCPVISSLAGASLAIAVVEPTISGVHDFLRVAGVCKHFNLPVAVIVNRYDLNIEGTTTFENLCATKNHIFLGKIPFSADLIAATEKGLAATELKSDVASTLKDIWDKVLNLKFMHITQLHALH